MSNSKQVSDELRSRPDAVEDEEELNKNAAERQNSAHQDPGHRTDVHGLLRNLTWNLIGAYRVLNCLKTYTHQDCIHGPFAIKPVRPASYMCPCYFHF